MMKKFYKCEVCGKVIQVETPGAPVSCCGKPMVELKANSQDAAVEKHIPEVTVDGNKISAVVGSVIHPMTVEHHIEWLWLETEKGGQFWYLKPNEEPKAEFVVSIVSGRIPPYFVTSISDASLRFCAFIL